MQSKKDLETAFKNIAAASKVIADETQKAARLASVLHAGQPPSLPNPGDDEWLMIYHAFFRDPSEVTLGANVQRMISAVTAYNNGQGDGPLNTEILAFYRAAGGAGDFVLSAEQVKALVELFEYQGGDEGFSFGPISPVVCTETDYPPNYLLPTQMAKIYQYLFEHPNDPTRSDEFQMAVFNYTKLGRTQFNDIKVLEDYLTALHTAAGGTGAIKLTAHQAEVLANTCRWRRKFGSLKPFPREQSWW